MQSLIFFLFSVLSALLGASCERTDSNHTRLTFWAMGQEGEQVGRLLTEFERGHPDIKVTVNSIPWSLAHEKLLTAYAGQSLPDVFQLGNTWVPEFKALSAIQPLDSLIARSSAIHGSDFFTGIWQTNVIDSICYGVPWYVDTRLLFYRRDLLRAVGYEGAPRTWDEWLQMAHKLKADGRYAVLFPLQAEAWQIPVILILANGGRLLKANYCRAAFDDSATVEALQYYLQFFKDGLAPKTMTQIANVYQAFEQGVIAMMVSGPWEIHALRSRVPGLSGKWTTAPMPRKENRASVAGGSSLVISAQTEHTEAAWQLIEFLSLPETQVEFFRLTRDLPTVAAAWQHEVIRTDAEIQAYYEQLQHVVPTPKIPEWEQVATKLQEHLERVALGQRSLQETIPRLNKDVDDILAKRRWLLTERMQP